MHSFTDKELAALKINYRLTTETSSSSIRAADLLDDELLSSYLVQVKEKINAANTAVAASLFTKRYSFAALIALYSMSALNKKISFSLENVSIETLDEADPLWLPAFKFHDLAADQAEEPSRLQWREKIVKQVFAGHMNVLFTSLNKKSKLSKLIMWENLYTYICWMYRSLLDDDQWSSRHGTIEDDFHFIISEAAGSLFGPYHQNPLSRYSKQKQLTESGGTAAQKRQTCCLSYLAGAKGKQCSICPIACKVQCNN